MKAKKCYNIILFVLIFTITSVLNVSALSKIEKRDDSSYEVLTSKTTYFTQDTKKNPTLKKIGTLVDNGYYNQETGEIDLGKLKEVLIDFVESDQEKYSYIKPSIDSMINSLSNDKSKRAGDNGILSTHGGIATVFNGWIVDPVLTSTEYWVTYSTSWLIEDNYRSSVPITTSVTRSLSTSRTLGFSGSADIKSKFGFSGSFTTTQTATVTSGANVPGWTVWGYRPYIRWTKDLYEGTWNWTYVVLGTGSVYSIDEQRTGENSYLRYKANEYWSRTNSAEDTSASTPSPPYGAPN